VAPPLGRSRAEHRSDVAYSGTVGVGERCSGKFNYVLTVHGAGGHALTAHGPATVHKAINGGLFFLV